MMMKLAKKRWLYLSFIVAFVFLSLSAFHFYDDDDDFEISKNLEIYYTLIRELNIYYVDKPDVGKLITENINNLLKGLDPYTVYIPETRIEDYKVMSTGEYGGIGALISIRQEKVLVTGLYQNSPASEVGLQVGDEILEISGKKMQKITMDEIGDLLKGAANTALTLKVRRFKNPEIKTFTLSRKDIKIKNVPYFDMLDDKIGYIKLTGFTYDAAQEVNSAFVKLKEQGMKHLVFDLRDNPGGLLIEAVKIVNLFVKKNELVVKILGRVEQGNYSFKTTDEPIDTLINVVVLVNSMSASASEIVSGALQDLDRAVILGEKTFGKGLVQTTRPLIYNAQLKLTTAKYYIPSGRCIQALDYAHRNPDGSVGNIPDSLISTFKTRKGRLVYDGGGVSPDVKVPSEKESTLVDQLLEQYVLFDFVTAFVYDNKPTYANVASIENQTNLFDEFVQYALKQGFKYKTKREEQLSKLIEIAKEEKTYSDIENEIISLQRKLEHNLDRDLHKFEKEITILLQIDLASRFFYQEGEIQQMLRYDSQLSQAVGLVVNQQKMNEILN